MLTKNDEPIQNGYYWIKTAGHEIRLIERRAAGYWRLISDIQGPSDSYPFAWWCENLIVLAVEPVKPASWIKEGGA